MKSLQKFALIAALLVAPLGVNAVDLDIQVADNQKHANSEGNAEIFWTAREYAPCTVYYSENPENINQTEAGRVYEDAREDNDFRHQYTAELNNLTLGANYYYQITCKPTENESINSDIFELYIPKATTADDNTTDSTNTTATATDTAGPVEIDHDNTTQAGTDEAVITWQAKNSDFCEARYVQGEEFGDSAGVLVSSTMKKLENGLNSFEASLTGLKSNTLYTYEIKCRNAAGEFIKTKTYNFYTEAAPASDDNKDDDNKTFEDILPKRVKDDDSDKETRSFEDALPKRVEDDDVKKEEKKTKRPELVPRDKGNELADIERKAELLAKKEVTLLLKELKVLRNTVKEQENRIKYLEKLDRDFDKLKAGIRDALNNFVTYGTDKNTQKLGEGQRAAVLHSYKRAFKALPQDEKDIEDVIKIANGRWPGKRNLTAEKTAKDQFVKVYKRVPNMNDARDNAAVTIITYGLQPKASDRNLASEKAAIKSYRAIYQADPKDGEDWDIVRAITYSGAARKVDTDGDLLSDEDEKRLGTDPRVKDSDGDGYPDGEEVLNGFDPTK